MMEHQKPIIEFRNIYKAFGEKKVLEDLNLSIYPGETLTILGGSGSGKSVTLKMLMGLIEPDQGEIYYQGHNIVQMDDDELRQMRFEIGMLFQNAALFDSLTVAENIAYPIIEQKKCDEAKIPEVVQEKLKLVGLDGTQENYPADISGGMRKRVGLARAIAADPNVILYDEPTAGLDPSNTRRIGELILRMQQLLKVTSVVVSHHMEFAFKISDRLALLYNRKVEFVGTVDEIKKTSNPIVAKFIHGEMEI